MSLRDELLRQKQAGDNEWAEKQAEEQRKRDEEVARTRAEAEKKRAAEVDRDRRKAESIFATLPEAVRQAAARGLATAVLADSFVAEKPEDGRPSLPFTIDRKTYFLTGWQIPFVELCRADSIPLTVVSERVDVALKGVLHKTFHVLAVDLRQL